MCLAIGRYLNGGQDMGVLSNVVVPLYKMGIWLWVCLPYYENPCEGGYPIILNCKVSYIGNYVTMYGCHTMAIKDHMEQNAW